jgi:hypothetical protein
MGPRNGASFLIFRLLEAQQTVTDEAKIIHAATLLEGDNASSWDQHLETNDDRPI